MDEEPRSLLIRIIETYSLDVINDKVRFGNLLNDYFQGKYRKEKNTLIASLEEGVPGDLIKSRTSVPAPVLVGQLAQRLTENRGISEDLAVWAVTTWALALRIPVDAAAVAQPKRNRTVFLTVNTTPQGAKVFVNSHYVGDSPITITSIPAGLNHVQCVLDGYEEWKKSFDLDTSSPEHSVTAALVRLVSKKAWVFTASNPPGALIYLDGVFKGNTPLSMPDLEPGNYAIKFFLQGFKSWEKTVSLHSGQLLNVHANLDKELNVGVVRVQSQPPGAACFIDGQYQGIVPTTYTGLPEGRHHVRCTFKGRGDSTQTVEIKAGQTLDLVFNFPSAMSQSSCDYCHRVQPLPFTCTRCGGQFCTEHRLPENHQCLVRRRKPMPFQPANKRPSPRATQRSPTPAFASQRPARMQTHTGSKFSQYAYGAAVSGLLAFVLFIGGGVSFMSLVLGLVSVAAAYAALQEKVK